MMNITPQERRLGWDEATYRQKREKLVKLAVHGEIPGLALILCSEDCRDGQPRHTTARDMEAIPEDYTCYECGAPAALFELIPDHGGCL